MEGHAQRRKAQKPQLDLRDPSLIAESERLLSGRIRYIWLTGPLLELYRAESWSRRSAIVRAWMTWVASLTALIAALAVIVVPGIDPVSALATALGVSAANIATIRVWRKPRGEALEGASVVVANLVLLFLFSAMGWSAGGYDHERFATGGMLVLTLATFVLGIEWRWAIAMGVAASAHYLLTQVTNPAVGLPQGLAVASFYAAGLYASAIARRTSIILSQRAFLMMLRDIRRSRTLADVNKRLEELATTDPLTGLANRRSATERIERVFGDPPTADRSIAFIMADIDHFKTLNDTRGHAVGDDCIRRVADAIRGCVREGRDLVSRHGGEEFLVLLTQVTLEEAMATAERIRATVAGLAIANPGAALNIVTISLGVALAEPGEAAEAVVTRADDALYGAKREGRNRVSLASPKPIEDIAFSGAETRLLAGTT